MFRHLQTNSTSTRAIKIEKLKSINNAYTWTAHINCIIFKIYNTYININKANQELSSTVKRYFWLIKEKVCIL